MQHRFLLSSFSILSCWLAWAPIGRAASGTDSRSAGGAPASSKSVAPIGSVSTGLAPAVKPSRQQELLQEELQLIEQEIKAVEKLVQSGRALPNDLLALGRARLQLQNQLLEIDPSPASLSRRKESLATEIKLVEQLLADQKRRVEVGITGRESLLAPQRELLKLQRELAALEENPSSRQSAAPAPTPNPANKQALLKEEIKLVEQQLAEHKELTEKKLASQSSLISVQRDLLKLKRELADAEAEAARGAYASAVLQGQNVRITVPDGASSAVTRSTGRGAVAGQIQPFSGESLQAGILEEELNLDLNAAIQSYQTLVTQFDGQRPLVANTVFRLGECYRKLGRMGEAKAQYDRILREFSDQTLLAKLCQKYLQPAAVSAGFGPGATDLGATTPGLVPETSAPASSVRDVRAQLEDLDLAHARSCLDRPTRQAARIAWEMRAVKHTNVLSLPTLADGYHQEQMDRFKAEYEQALRPAVNPPGGSSRSGRGRVQKGDVVKRMETWVKEIYLPEQEVNLRLTARQAGRWSNEIQQAEAMLRDYVARHPDAPFVHRPGANPPQVEDVLQRMERVRTEGINLLRRMVEEEAILAVATNSPPEALSVQILGKWYRDYKQPDLYLASLSSPEKFESMKTNMAAWLKDDFLPEKERSLREMQGEYTRLTNEVAKLESSLDTLRPKGSGLPPSETRPAANPDRATLEWQLAQARKEEIEAKRELANGESLLSEMENQVKANPQSERAKTDLLRAHNKLQAAKEQHLLWSKEAARLEARLKELPVKEGEGSLPTAEAEAKQKSQVRME